MTWNVSILSQNFFMHISRHSKTLGINYKRGKNSTTQIKRIIQGCTQEAKESPLSLICPRSAKIHKSAWICWQPAGIQKFTGLFQVEHISTRHFTVYNNLYHQPIQHRYTSHRYSVQSMSTHPNKPACRCVRSGGFLRVQRTNRDAFLGKWQIDGRAIVVAVIRRRSVRVHHYVIYVVGRRNWRRGGTRRGLALSHLKAMKRPSQLRLS